MSNLAIIPARGGSKRIPRKNIRDFLGKPIIAYPIETALKSGLFDEVMVSTDDPNIAEIALSYGASVPFMRSAENSDDHSSTVDVLVEVLGKYASEESRTFEYACCIYPATPLINAVTLQQGFEKLIAGKYETVFPALPYSYPIWRGIRMSSDGKVTMIWPENQYKRTQDLEPALHDAGQWYWFSVPALLNSGRLFTDNSSIIMLDEMQAQDIDNSVDWALTELKYRLQQENERSA